MRLDVTAQDKGWLLAELTNYGKFTGMWYILRPEPEVEVIKRPLKYLVKDFLAGKNC